jgi:hypothetical protein
MKKIFVSGLMFFISFQCFAGRTDGLTSSDFKNRMEEFGIVEIKKERGKYSDLILRHKLDIQLTEGVHAGKIVYTADRSLDRSFKKYDLWMRDPENPEKDAIRLTRYNDVRSDIVAFDPVQLTTGIHAGKIVYRSDRSKNGADELWMLDPENPEKDPVQLTRYNETHNNVDSIDPVQLTKGIHAGKIVYSTDRSRRDRFELWMLDPENPEKDPIQLTHYDETHDYVGSSDPILLTT